MRLTLRTFNAIKAHAHEGDAKPSVLMRRWIEEGLQRESGHHRSDVMAELRTAVEHVAREMARRSDAA